MIGYILWFEPYQGASDNVNDMQLGLGAKVVLKYADELQTKFGWNLSFHLYFDNFFSSIPLIHELKNRGFRATGTIRENRTSKCPLSSNKEFQKTTRGKFEYNCTLDENIVVCKWNDNSVVTVTSNTLPVLPVKYVRRYSQREKRYIFIQQPNLVKHYNANTGGVDRADQNISLYRISIRGKKWYFPLFAHCIDMIEHNAWQIHKQQGGTMDHLAFRRAVTVNMLETYKKTGKRGPCKGTSHLNENSRYDQLNHLIRYQENQTRCVLCSKKAQFKCIKCNVVLHPKFCFEAYHTKK